jgi:DNA-binding SARP family transcriptional activator
VGGVVHWHVLARRLVVLCGGPDVAVEGTRLRLAPPSRGQATLALGFLLLEPERPVPADELAEAVWPMGPPGSWTSGLRRILSELRRWLQLGEVDAHVRSTHGSYELLLPPQVVTDVAAARVALHAVRAADRADLRPELL